MSQSPQAGDSSSHVAGTVPPSGVVSATDRGNPRPTLRLISFLDLLTVIGLIVLIPVAWFLPQPAWPKLGRGIIAPVLRLLPWLETARAARVVPFLGEASLRYPTNEVLVRELSRYFEDTLLLLKCYRPGDWEPVVEVRGAEHLQAAVSRGQGVVLWFSHFVHASLISKIAMHQAGFSMSHLTHPRHGFSWTRFGMQFLNPVRTQVEERYLRERVCMGMDSAATAVNILRDRLHAGGIVSITARDIARKPVRVPFLGGYMSLAIGAPNFALQTKSTLLPVHALQMDSGGYVAIIEPPIVMDDTQPRWIAGEAAVREYARRLEPYVREYPDQWLGWEFMYTTSTTE